MIKKQEESSWISTFPQNDADDEEYITDVLEQQNEEEEKK